MDLNAVHQGIHTHTWQMRRHRQRAMVRRGIFNVIPVTPAPRQMFRRLFEGGQTPLYRRSPKRVFSHRSWDTPARVINVGDIDAACGFWPPR